MNRKSLIPVHSEAYNPSRIALRIISLLSVVREDGILKLEEIAETEENKILQAGFRAIADGKLVASSIRDYSKKEKARAKAKAVMHFVNEECKKYSFRDKSTRQVMAAGLYAIDSRYSPLFVQKLYDFAMNPRPENIPDLRQLE
jgi:hypothetical protein